MSDVSSALQGLGLMPVLREFKLTGVEGELGGRPNILHNELD